MLDAEWEGRKLWDAAEQKGGSSVQLQRTLPSLPDTRSCSAERLLRTDKRSRAIPLRERSDGLSHVPCG